MAERGISAFPANLIVKLAHSMDPVGVSQFSQTCKKFYDIIRIERRNAARRHSWTPERHYSRRMRDPRIARLLPEDDLYDGPNTGPLPQVLLAIHEDRAGALRGYLEAGVDPNRFWGESRLLREAACFDDMECVKVLLEYGADPALPDGKIRRECPRTPLSRAASMVFRREIPAMNSSIYHRRSSSIFHNSIWRPEYDRVTRLMEAGVRITRINEIVWIRWQVNFWDVLKLAVEQGTDLSKLAGSSALTVLHVAISYAHENHYLRFSSSKTEILCHNDFETIEWIITKYPDLINARTYRGETPFDWAFDVRRFDIARLLLLRGVGAGFAEKYDWYSEIIKRETSIEKVELLLEMREQLMCYDGVYHRPQLQERCPLMRYIWFPSY